jgi:hypothetical protein
LLQQFVQLPEESDPCEGCVHEVIIKTPQKSNKTING